MDGKVLAHRKCVPCEGGMKPLDKESIHNTLQSLNGWSFNSTHHSIERSYVMKNFGSAVDLIGNIAKLADEENHHPDLHLTGYRHLKIVLTTHAIGGVSDNDFILAAKIDVLPKELKA